MAKSHVSTNIVFGLINFKLKGKVVSEGFCDFCSLVESTSVGIVIHEKCVVCYANPAIAAKLGVDESGTLVGKSVLDYVAGDIRAEVAERMQRMQQGEVVVLAEVKLLKADGSSFLAEVRGTPIYHEGKPAALVLIQDITERKMLENTWRQYSFIVNASDDFMNLISRDYAYQAVNEAFLKAFGKSREEVIGKSVADFWGQDVFDLEIKPLLKRCFRGETVQAEFEFRQSFLGLRYCRANYYPYYGEEHKVTHAVVISSDISDRKAAEEKLSQLSYYDELTGLPNRRLFADRVDQALAFASREKSSLALIYLDLDRFKFINDTMGHACGDQVLKEAAQRFEHILRASDSAARMGGDEFTVLLPGAGVNTVMRVANKLRVALQKPYLLREQEFTLDASFGIAVFPQDGKDLETLLKHADTAMYHAKRDHSHIHCFSSGMEKQVVYRLYMEQELARAADEMQLELYYQSQHALNTDDRNLPFPLHYQSKHQLDDGAIIGVEGLVRWKHPKFGMVSPAEFIPLAEETGQIRPITHWVLAEAGRQATLWEKAGIRPERIGVNISAVQLMQNGLAEEILERINATGARPEWIEIEITETAAMRDPETGIAIMRKLVDAGITIAIDDFGTGYSSLAYLKRLPAQWLKIDITFIRGLPDDVGDISIVRSIIAMGHSMGMRIIAEGVETEAQLKFLRDEGCDAVQGFLMSRPLPADEAGKYLTHKLKS